MVPCYDGFFRRDAKPQQNPADATGVVIGVAPEHEYRCMGRVSDGSGDGLAGLAHGCGCYAAGVDDNEVALFGVPGRVGSFGLKSGRDGCGVILIDLAA